MYIREENESIECYCRRLKIIYDEPECWYKLPEYLPTTHSISNYGRIRYNMTGTIYKNKRTKKILTCIATDDTYYNIARLLVYLKYKYMRNRYIGNITFTDGNELNCKLSNVTAKFSIMGKDNPEWVPLFNGYIINKYGEVANSTSSTLLNCTYHKNKYKVAKIVNDAGDTISVYIAKTVAKLFIPNPYQCKYIEYKDSDMSNCKAENLRWTISTRY